MAATLVRGVRLVAALLTAVSAAVGAGITASAAPYAAQPTLSVSRSVSPRGGNLTVFGSNWTPGARVYLTMHTDSVFLGSATVGPNGRFNTGVTIRSTTTPGSHRITCSEPSSGQSLSAIITITAAAAPPPSAPSPQAFTAVAVMGLGALGFVLLIGGGVMLLLGRRRKAST